MSIATIVREIRFEAAHFLPRTPEGHKCRNLHGHSYAVEVHVIGTLKNTLGPHHNSPPLGRAWPGSFQQGAKGGRPPGKGYDFVGYGLFEDFKILRK